MSQISSSSSISSASMPSESSKKVIGVPSNNVYTVMLGVTFLLLAAGMTIVVLQYRSLYPNLSVTDMLFLADIKK